MSAARRVNPKLAAALQTASVEPFDFDTPGRIVEVPVPAEHFAESPEPEKPQPSRFDRVKAYLEATRLPEAPPDFGPEADVSAAREADARRDFGNSMLAAGQAFTGNRAAVGKLQETNTNEMSALAQNAARRKALEEWASNRERLRLAEANVLSSALVEPSRKDPELEGRRLDQGDARLELEKARAEETARHNKAMEEAKKKAPKAPVAPDEVRFEDMTFKYVGKADAPKDVRIAGAKKVRETAAAWAAATSAMNDLEAAMREFQRDPSINRRSMLYAPALVAAGAVNSAIGQGAMSDAEKQAQFQALGINLADPASVQALLERDPEGFVKRVLGAKKIARGAITAQARVYGYDPTAPTEQKQDEPPAMVKVRRKADGVVKMLPKSKADELAKGEKFEVVP